MFYIKSNPDNFIELLTQYEFDAPEPYFHERLFGKNPQLNLVPVEVLKYGSHVIILEKHSGLWCFLENDEYALYVTLAGIKLSDLLGRLSQLHREDVEEFLVRLYWLGLLQINGRSFFEVDAFNRRANFTPGPLFTIVPTERCNLACNYCSARSHPGRRERMDWTIAKRILDLIVDFPVEHLQVQFHGGEALLEVDMLERVITYALQRAGEVGKQVHFRVQTNGTLLTPTVLQRLADLEVGIGLSLDGDQAANNLTRVFPGNKSSYAAVTRTISMLKEKNFEPGVLCVVSKANYLRFNQIMEHFLFLGLEKIKSSPIMRLGRANDQWHALELAPEEFLEAHLTYLDYAVQAGGVAVDTAISSMIGELASSRHSYICQAGRQVLTFTPDGNIYPCGRYRNREELYLGNVGALERLEGLWKSHSLLARITERQVSLIPECRECAFQRFCEADCPLDSYSYFGTTQEVHPWCNYYRGMYRALFGKLAEGPRVREIFYPGADVYEKSLFGGQS
jgi:uncharacterized protein